MCREIKRKYIGLIILSVLTVSLFRLTFKIHRVKASSRIVIRADGSIEGTANMTSADNIAYTFTDNNYDEIVVQRGNIVIDGNGYSLQGNGSGLGFFWLHIDNVTIKNVNIKNFSYGIAFENSSFCKISENNITSSVQYGISIGSSSNNNTIFGNNITNNRFGVGLYSSYNNVSSNIFTNNGLHVDDPSYQNMVNNNLVNGKPLVYLEGASDIVVEDAGQVVLIKCNHIRVKNLNLSYASIGVQLEQTSNTEIFGNNITNNEQGILVSSSTNTTVIGNNVTNNLFGIMSHSYSSHNIICENNITNNNEGITLLGSLNSSISANKITSNQWGIYLMFSSNNNSISRNNLKDNGVGISLYSSSNNIFIGNNIVSHDHGIMLTMSSSNCIHHNNFVNNFQEVRLELDNRDNIWNDRYPYGGNYWSNYYGTDLDQDGIGNFPYVFDANNTDNYPLMGVFHSFTTPLGKSVNVISNSTVDSFQYESPDTIRFRVLNTTVPQTHGFCRVNIPYDVLSAPLNVTVDGATPTYWNYTLHDNGTHRWIYFEYTHSTREVVIIPELPTLAILPLFMTATLVVALAYRRKRY